MGGGGTKFRLAENFTPFVSLHSGIPNSCCWGDSGTMLSPSPPAPRVPFHPERPPTASEPLRLPTTRGWFLSGVRETNRGFKSLHAESTLGRRDGAGVGWGEGGIGHRPGGRTPTQRANFPLAIPQPANQGRRDALPPRTRQRPPRAQNGNPADNALKRQRCPRAAGTAAKPAPAPRAAGGGPGSAPPCAPLSATAPGRREDAASPPKQPEGWALRTLGTAGKSGPPKLLGSPSARPPRVRAGGAAPAPESARAPLARRAPPRRRLRQPGLARPRRHRAAFISTHRPPPFSSQLRFKSETRRSARSRCCRRRRPSRRGHCRRCGGLRRQPLESRRGGRRDL